MKQGILVIAYKNFDHLYNLIRFFDDDFSFYIHIDKKSAIDEAVLQQIKSLKNVRFLSRKYSIRWASFQYLEAVLELAREALCNKEIGYFHLISGHDYPIQSCAYFKEFLESNRGKDFLEHDPLPFYKWDSFRWSDGGFGRMRYYNLYELFNAKRSSRINEFILWLVKLQWKLGLHRKFPNDFPKLYGGSSFWTLSRESLQYAIEYTDRNPQFLRRFRYSFCPEEMYFQTILMNSPLRDKLVHTDLRYIDWNMRNGNEPANLDETDLAAIRNSTHLFARKFEFPVSQKLLVQLKQDLKAVSEK